MRDIKFRAWDKESSEMVYFNNRKLTQDEYQRAHLAMLLAGDYGDVLMQFIGLQDVNGVDIYEGDIVSHADSQVWTVEFSDNEAAFIVYNQLNSNRRLQSSFGDHYSVDDDNVMNMAAVFNIASREESPCEITGNIYQNPELLK
jgi:uncharacterized phage protein (TIGR01671 family)